MSVTRRTALQALAAGLALPLRVRGARDGAKRSGDAAAKAVLYDSTRCIGCRECVIGCAEANGWDAEQAFGADLRLTDSCLTFLQKYDVPGGDAFRNVQCMHCVEPACVSACIT